MVLGNCGLEEIKGLPMLSVHPILILLLFIVGLLSALIIWGFWQTYKQKFNKTLIGSDGGNLPLWLLALAIFSLGVFITYVLFIFIPGGF